jgi:glycerophosphoryl diester phosphodiesterase
VLAFAHRGGAYHPEIEGLENTLHAFRHAVELGYRHLETDVHLSSDGHLLAFHDAILDRVTDRIGPVADLTLAEIRKARIGGVHQVPTLAELVDDLPAYVGLNIDLKAAGTPAALATFLDERRPAGGDLDDRLIVGSFDRRRLLEFRRLTAGRVRTSAHPGEVAIWLLSPSARVAGRLTGDFVAFQVPRTRRVGGRDLPIVTAAFVRRAHRGGRQVHVWTVDDVAEMSELVDLGVDGLMTDRTDLLKEFLLGRGLWEAS